MRIIRVSQTASTNSFLKELHREQPFYETVCVIAEQQTAGRGQKGNSWLTEPFQNLTFSVLLPDILIPLKKQYQLNMQLSLGLLKSLSTLNIPKLALKWPNDIMADSKKIGGILIENSITGAHLKHSVIGVGLNVNQTFFEGLPKASSLKLSCNATFNLEEVLQAILKELDKLPEYLNTLPFKITKKNYEDVLFRKDVISVFEDVEGYKFNGVIKGVTDDGLLKVETDDALKLFDLKEVKLLF
jgi:BirA family biotin operon repressor/biotin-[acetyl-CoA-carboxylase] ligase